MRKFLSFWIPNTNNDRCGLHCAPLAHQTLGTYPQGTVRFAFGHENTEEKVEYAANAIREILEQSEQ